MEFTNSELNLICTAMSEYNAKRIKLDCEKGISVESDKYIKMSNEISKKVYDELTKRAHEKEVERQTIMAKFIKKEYTVEGFEMLTYSYRGKQYQVIDYGWHGGEPLSCQHKNEQAKIDQEIELENKRMNSDFVEEPAEAGLEMFWKSFEE